VGAHLLPGDVRGPHRALQLTRNHLWVLKELANVVDWRAWDGGGVQGGQPVGLGLGAHDTAENVAERPSVGDAGRVGGKARVLHQLGQVQCATRPSKLAVVPDRHDDVAAISAR
jgi:hypothetical protein